MKKIFNSLMILAAAAATFASCSKEVDTQDNGPVAGKMKTVTVKTSIDTRTTLDNDHVNLVWTAGDKISIFNDQDNTNLEKEYEAGGDLIVSVPAATTEIYAHYPYYDGNTYGRKSVSVYISNKQTQAAPGQLNGYYYPMVAKGTVSEDNKAIISLYPVASALALNIYHTGLSGEETVKSVKVTPSSNTGFIGRQITDITGDDIQYTSTESSEPITVTLTNPLTLHNAKPSNSQTFDGQIYVCLAKQSYANVTFEISTSKGTYTIASNNTPFNCEENDFVPVNINLARATSFEPAEVDYVTLPWEWVGSAAAGKDDLSSNNGVKVYGLGSDYAVNNAPYRLKFDGVGDYVLIKTDKAIGSVIFDTKTLGGSNGASLIVQGSTDGNSFTNVETFSTAKNQNIEETFTTTAQFDASYRFVRLYMSVKGSNIGMGRIKITSGVAEPTIDNFTINAAAAGGEGLTAEVSLSNYSVAPTLTVTADGSVVSTASILNVSPTNATVVYTLAPNCSGETKTGLITLKDENNVSGKITINQAADVFYISETEIELAADANASKTFKVTSDFDWTVDDALIDGFTVSPMSAEGSSSSVTVTVSSVSANTSVNDIELGAFAIKRTIDGKESETITVVQKSAKLATPVVSITPNGANRKFEASWVAISNATQYLYYVLDEDANVVIDETTVTSTSIVVENLETGVEYTIFVKAQGDAPYIDSEEGSASVTLSAGVITKTLTITMNEYVSAHDDITVSSGSNIGTIATSLSLNDVVTMSTTGKPNCGTFWGASPIDWRLYQNQNGNVTISVSEGHNLVSVKFTYSVSNNGVLKDANLGNVNSGDVKTVSGSSITYTVGNKGSATNGQVRITAVEVKYQ